MFSTKFVLSWTTQLKISNKLYLIDKLITFSYSHFPWHQLNLCELWLWTQLLVFEIHSSIWKNLLYVRSFQFSWFVHHKWQLMFNESVITTLLQPCPVYDVWTIALEKKNCAAMFYSMKGLWDWLDCLCFNLGTYLCSSPHIWSVFNNIETISFGWLQLYSSAKKKRDYEPSPNKQFILTVA